MGLAHTWRVKGKPFQRMQLLRFMGGAEEGLMSFPNKYPPKRRGQMLSPVRVRVPPSPPRRLTRCSFLWGKWERGDQTKGKIPHSPFPDKF